MKHLFLEGELTTLNKYIDAERANRYAGAQIKDDETNVVILKCKEIGLEPISAYPVEVQIVWSCKNKRSDPDNIAFATKFILDGLVRAGILKDDGWDEICSIIHTFKISRNNPGIDVYLYEGTRNDDD